MPMRRLLLAVTLATLVAMTARATDQTILGQKIQVTDPSVPEKRKIVAAAKEKGSLDMIVGDPVANGATLTINANGGTSTSESYALATGTIPLRLKPFWTGDPVKGFKYADTQGENGPAKKVQIKKTSSGVFQIKVTVDAKLGPVGVVPPNPGTDACLLLEITGGDSYSAKFGDGDVKNAGAKQFKISKPTIEGTCVVTTTSTIETTTSTTETTTPTTESTTSTTESTTSTTTTTEATTTSTTQPCPPGETLCGSTCVDTAIDAAHCGTCGNDCNAGAVNATFTCQTGSCAFAGCNPGFWDLDGNQTCEYACTFVSPQETCNGADDDCDGLIDEGVILPTPWQVCGVSPAATAPECTSQVSIACSNGSWQCTFPAGVCTGGCANATEVCDALDNDCDGALNETTPSYGQPCASDDGLPPPGHGPCRTTGAYVCNGPTATKCNAVKASCASLPGGCTELPDGVDNDCDGSIDETFNAKGTNAAFFVKPAVTKTGTSTWVYSYEASRPSATATEPGRGNGWQTSALPGSTIDKTRPGSVQGRLPWSTVSGAEAEQACTAVGGALCSTSQLQTACTATASCTWGYNPRGLACTSGFTGSKYCNLQGSFDTAPGTAGDQDGMLATGSAALQSCWADWSSLQGNTAATNKIFDVTGNLRELTKTSPGVYTLLGGSNLTQVEAGAACLFTTFQANQNFAYPDTGFRCCFTSDPTL